MAAAQRCEAGFRSLAAAENISTSTAAEAEKPGRAAAFGRCAHAHVGMEEKACTVRASPGCRRAGLLPRKREEGVGRVRRTAESKADEARRESGRTRSAAGPAARAGRGRARASPLAGGAAPQLGRAIRPRTGRRSGREGPARPHLGLRTPAPARAGIAPGRADDPARD